jgi:Uma2 family endonuclease
MTRVLSTGPPSPGPPPDRDPFRYGWRYVRRTLPDGRVVVDEVPLTPEDVLHPQEDDVIPENRVHEPDRRYLSDVFHARYAKEPQVVVLSDCLVDWGVPGLRSHSPDIVILEGARTEQKGSLGTYRLRQEGGHPLLVIEIVSPDPQMRENDVVKKVAHYHRAGVPLYVIVDWKREDEPRRLLAYRDTPQGYVEIPLDPEGRVLLGSTGILLGLKDERVVCYDQATGKELGNYASLFQQLQEAEQRQWEAEQRAEANAARLRELEEQLRRLQENRP